MLRFFGSLGVKSSVIFMRGIAFVVAELLAFRICAVLVMWSTVERLELVQVPKRKFLYEPELLQ